MRKKLNSFLENLKKDYPFMTVAFSAFSILIGTTFMLYNGVLGIAYKSLWNGSICVYYFLLAVIRAIVIYLHKKESARHKKRSVVHLRIAYFATHIALMIMNISLIIPIAVMVTGGRSYKYGLIPAIALSAYTTYRISMSITHYIKARRNTNLFIAELRTINMIDSLVAVLTLQNALIIANNGMNAQMQTLSAWTSAGILLIIIIITVHSLLRMRKTKI